MSDSPLWPDPAELEIEPEAVHALQEAGEPFRLIDCREPDEYEIARLPQGELFPLGTIGTDYATRLPDPAEPIVIHCHHGMRSAKAALFLRQKGYQNVWSMAHGIDGWSRDIDPTVPLY